MSDLPKIVRQRLNVQPVSNHPDPDVLTAFSESLLPRRERALVMEHLAHCGGCRDVVALALPDVQTTAAAHPLRGTPKPWLTWPALRWGLVAAGMAVIISAGLMYQRRPASMMASRFSLPTDDKKAESAKPNPGSAQKIAKDEPDGMLTNNAPAAESKLPSASRQAPARGRTKTSGGLAGAGSASTLTSNSTLAKALPSGDASGHIMHGLADEQSNLSARAAKQKDLQLPEKRVPSPSSEVVEVQSQEVAAAAEGGRHEQILDAQNEQAYDRADKVDKAKPPVTAQSAPAAAPAPPVAAPATQPPQAILAGYLPAPRWTVSADGSLQRSYDGGKTWQNVDVNGQPASTTSSLQVVGEQLAKKEVPREEEGREKKSVARAISRPIFRAVAILGSEVWAGGVGGALYHSVDGGMHWMRVIPSAKGTALTSDIIRLEFPDSQHVRITTSTAEVWTTADGGQSWQH